jgi:diaminopimelate epimerase
MTMLTMSAETSKRKIPFTKMTGTGNDFIIFNNLKGDFPDFDRPLLAKTVCRRTLSLGADGIVFLDKLESGTSNFKWDFYNADGSPAEFCGNAARCVARFAFELGVVKAPQVLIQTNAGEIRAEVLSSGEVVIEMPKPEIIVRKLEVKIAEDETVFLLYVNTGVPHVVIESNQWDQDYLLEMGSFLRHHELFEKTSGANVTFFEAISENVIQSATFERGVEGVTMACGTGAVAAAIAGSMRGIKSPSEVQVPGGLLKVDLSSDLRSAKLTGEARFICDGFLRSEALL